MPRVTIIAQIKAKVGQANFVKSELEKLVPITRNETGCIQYDLHQDNEDPSYFVFYENWQTRKNWDDHMNAPHLRAFVENTKEALDDLAINEMTKTD